MVILIGGASCTGKTLLAHSIMKKHNISYYSIDHLKMGLFRGTDDCGFTPTDSNAYIGGKLWPIIREIIKTAIENKQNLIIEGAYLFPEYFREFTDDYSNNILPIFMCFSDDYIRENFDTGIMKYRNIIEKRVYKEEREVEDFIKENSELAIKCEESKLKCFTIVENYKEEIENICLYIQRNINS